VLAVHWLTDFHCESLVWSSDRRCDRRRQMRNDTTNTYFNHEICLVVRSARNAPPPLQPRQYGGFRTCCECRLCTVVRLAGCSVPLPQLGTAASNSFDGRFWNASGTAQGRSRPVNIVSLRPQ
jgi:hypothetical protein